MQERLKGVIISDFNCDVMVGYLNNLAMAPACSIKTLPFGQVYQTLSNPKHPAWDDASDFAVIWCQPWSILPSLAKLMNFQDVNPSSIEQEVLTLASHIREKAASVKHVIVCLFALPHHYRGTGPLDYSQNGVRRWLHRANGLLIDALTHTPNVIFKDPNHWLHAIGPKAVNPKLWYVSKLPYDMEVLKTAAIDIKQTLGVFYGQTKKLIILDLDNTLWGGELGDLGKNNIKLGGHDATGEAFVDFQRQLKILRQRGIVLAIVSKNDESTALDAITTHPEMILRKEDFAAWRINWSDKAQNIVDILNELNLPASAAVYIDDHPAERDRIKTSIADITVPTWPTEHYLYAQTLAAMPYFDMVAVTTEDKQRTDMYVAEQKRQDLKQPAMSVKDWLTSLHMVLTIEPLDSSNLSRAVQLLNKTNQMNLKTRRMTEQEYWQWANMSGRHVFVFRVSDDLGDSGLTGMIGLSVGPDTAYLEDFILSCRVFGRFVEDAMMAKAVVLAKSTSRLLVADYVKTEKNQPCLEFLERSGLDKIKEYCYTWDLQKLYPYPDALTIRELIGKT